MVFDKFSYYISPFLFIVNILIYRLVQLVERQTSLREVSGSSPDRTNTQGLKITEENVLPL